MLTVALQSAGMDPSFAIGGTINTAGTNAIAAVDRYLSPKQMNQMVHF